MDTLTRRRFLLSSGVAGAAALVAGGTAYGVHELLASGGAADAATSPVLVLVTLYGGNDGLNTVVPAADRAYQDARSELAYSEDEVLPLGDGLGLNPGMKGFKKLWDDKKLAVVRGVSYPRPDHSHFRSMSIWQTGSPSSPVPSGWLGRWLDTFDTADPLRAVSVGATLPPLLAGERTAGAAVRLGGGGLPDAWLRTCTELSRTSEDAHPLLARAAASLGDVTRIDAAFADRGAGSDRPGGKGAKGKKGDGPQPSGSPVPHSSSVAAEDPGAPREGDEDQDMGASAGGQGELAGQLDVVARAITAGATTRAYSVSLGGFDTHANEKGTQSRLLGQLDHDLTAFLDRVRSAGAGRPVVVAVYSEFGRRPRANGNQGTDHGTSGPVFVLGDPVHGGFYGDQPSLTRLTDGDLATTTDFRDVYATLLHRVLDSDPGRILDGHDRTLGFL
ncbi:DUF1501 domain-containing protein [Streptomyces sp. RKAG290]|uniref:DUF1501 domain-containing protein n=1 Tax=Streptomyces sp. RKAG290 TaxID=2888348 RepID=UPI0020340DD3|nr:DUF1501 domain-containing protein [Streptomyces sp. RKAG290]MCM2411082.1 DUF1501 domain-containing protein [Streptomyces sp. RKAG290]